MVILKDMITKLSAVHLRHKVIDSLKTFLKIAVEVYSVAHTKIQLGDCC
jgi:hypothetical protein